MPRPGEIGPWKTMATRKRGPWTAVLEQNQAMGKGSCRVVIIRDEKIVLTRPAVEGGNINQWFNRFFKRFARGKNKEASRVTNAIPDSKEIQIVSQPTPTQPAVTPPVVTPAPTPPVEVVATVKNAEPTKKRHGDPRHFGNMSQENFGRLVLWMVKNQRMLQEEPKSLKAVAAMVSKELLIDVRPINIKRAQKSTGITWIEPTSRSSRKGHSGAKYVPLSLVTVEAVLILFKDLGGKPPADLTRYIAAHAADKRFTKALALATELQAAE